VASSGDDRNYRFRQIGRICLPWGYLRRDDLPLHPLGTPRALTHVDHVPTQEPIMPRQSIHRADDALRQLVSLATIAQRLEVTRTTARRLLEQAGVQPFFLSTRPGGTIRFALDDVRSFVAQARGEALHGY